MSDFDHDLYGDLDLEDLDATQLDDELVDPELEEEKPAAAAAKQEEKPQPEQYTQQQQQQPPQQQQQYGFDAGQQQQQYNERPRADVADEGLVSIGRLVKPIDFSFYTDTVLLSIPIPHIPLPIWLISISHIRIPCTGDGSTGHFYLARLLLTTERCLSAV